MSIDMAPAMAEESPDPKPGKHGQLSYDRRGPNAARHASDVFQLLAEQRKEAEVQLSRARSDLDRAQAAIEKWERQVAEYAELIAAVDKAGKAIS